LLEKEHTQLILTLALSRLILCQHLLVLHQRLRIKSRILSVKPIAQRFGQLLARHHYQLL
jgi:hypothetical protein